MTNFCQRKFAAIALIIISLVSSFSIGAADLVVRNFKSLPTDQTAINRETMRKDLNGKTAALIKIYTNLNPTQTYFNNGVMGIVERINKPGQIWLYIPARTQSIEISNAKYPSIRYFFDEEITAGRTYSMDLDIKGKDVILSASVNKAPIYVDGDSIGLSPQTVYLAYGEHAVKAEQGSMLYEGNIIVSEEGPSRFTLAMEDENLKYTGVTVTVPDNADIYFEGRRVGLGEWHTRLREGHYSVELRKTNCENTVEQFEVRAGVPCVVNAKAPVPFMGHISVDVIPNTGVKILNGDTIVAEHRLSRQLKVGKYSFTFDKKGYVPMTKTFTVERNKETTDTVSLQRIQYIRSNAIYAGAGFVYGTISGVGVHVGGIYDNFNLEIGYTMGIGKSDDVYWYETATDIYDDKCTYSLDEIAVKAGYQFSFVERIGLTPQLGYLGQRLRGGIHGNGAMCHNLSIGARFVFNPLPMIGVFVTPEYAVPVSVNELYKEISGIGGFSKGGVYVNLGVTFNF